MSEYEIEICQNDRNIINILLTGKNNNIIINALFNEKLKNDDSLIQKCIKYNINIGNLCIYIHSIQNLNHKHIEEEIMNIDLILYCPEIVDLMFEIDMNFFENKIKKPIIIMSHDNIIIPHKHRYIENININTNIEFSKNDIFWKTIIDILPNDKINLINNFDKYSVNKNKIKNEIREYINNNYNDIPEYKTKINKKEKIIHKMNLISNIFVFLYIIFITITFICKIACYYNNIIIFSIIYSFISFVIIFKLINILYKKYNYGIFPIIIHNIEINNIIFNGVILSIGENVKINGIAVSDNCIYNFKT